MKNKKKEPIKKKRVKKDKISSSFLERPLPESDEVSQFEEAIKKEVATEEIDANLSAIYSDKKGELVDVSKVKKRKRLILLVFFKKIFVLTILACALYGLYYFYFQKPSGAENIVLNIDAPERASSGEPISYDIFYHNDSGLVLNNVHLEIIFPDSFVITEMFPPSSGLNSWSLDSVQPNQSGMVSVSGYLAAPVDSANIIRTRLSYVPSNFSSEFRREASANTVISNLGFLSSLNYVNTALIEKDNEIKLNLSNFKDNYFSDLYLQIDASDNLKINKTEIVEYSDYPDLLYEAVGDRSWLLKSLPFDSQDRFSFPINFTFLEKITDDEELTFSLFKKEIDGRELILWERSIVLEVVKSDLNISLSLNNQKVDQAVDFSSTLNYKLEYSNDGETTLYDVVLMAVINGPFINWSSFEGSAQALIASNSLMWTKENLSTLAELSPGESGEINFSLQLNDFSLSDISGDNSIVSYAQYNFNNQEGVDSEDNRSNTIRSFLNSDLSLSEKILYFNDDNLPVGSGPLPPKVGETTSLRVLWTVKNNLHDLNDLKVSMNLSPKVEWGGLVNTNVGSISYDEDNRVVNWRLGYLPLSVYRADAEFSIEITPTGEDYNKILVISPGSEARAVDAVTKAELVRTTNPKTSKLEDDEIASLSNSGKVE